MTGGLNGTEGETATADQVTEQEIRSQLERILLSPWFKNSKRHPRFLRFVIDKALSGTAQDIKERIVGVEVFDREIHYDVSSDPIVRVAAGEIRKRLAQYYIQPGHEQELRIELSPGSYVPAFHRPHEADAAVIDGTHVSPQLIVDSVPSLKPAHHALDSEISVATAGGRNRIFAVLAFAVVVLMLIIAAASVWLSGNRHSSDLDMFWQPLLSANSGTILCIGDLNYLIKNQSPTLPEDVNRIFAARDHVAAKDTLALARLAGFMGKSDRYGSVLLADNATLTDLRGEPAIMIGAFDNHWTEELLSGYRFQFTRDTATQVGTIRDTRNSARASWGIDLRSPPAAVHKDYALVSRIKSPITEQTELIIAGIGPSGTVAASEFITNPRYFSEFVKRAPTGWQNREIQIVITTEVIGERSAPPHVLTFDVR